MLNGGGAISGTLIGIDITGVTMKSQNGDIKDIPMTTIEKVFDSDGKRISLEDYTSNSDDSNNDNNDDGYNPPSRHPHKNHPRADAYEDRDEEKSLEAKSGMVAAGKVMFWTGLPLTIAGVILAAAGENQLQTDDAAYNKDVQNYNNSNNNYYKIVTNDSNTINNDMELEGLGVVIGCIGLANGITGLILWHVGNSHIRNSMDDSGLINIEDKNISWNFPNVNLAQIRYPRITLLSANF